MAIRREYKESMHAVGSLWRHGIFKREEVVVLGNCASEGEIIWCANWATGDRRDVQALRLQPLPECKQPMLEAVYLRCVEWAGVGNHDAAWWLAWANTGVNHPRATWYYIAALRMRGGRHHWAWRRIERDTYHGAMREGVPHPALEYLDEIEEFNGGSSSDWKTAILNAERAVHAAAGEDAYRRAATMMKNIEDARPRQSVLKVCGVTEEGFAGWLAALPAPPAPAFPPNGLSSPGE